MDFSFNRKQDQQGLVQLKLFDKVSVTRQKDCLMLILNVATYPTDNFGNVA